VNPWIWPRPTSGSGWKDGPSLGAPRGPLTAVAILVVVALLLTACASPPEDSCENARLAVAVYDAANAAGERLPSKDERIAAAVARTFLEVRCDVR